MSIITAPYENNPTNRRINLTNKEHHSLRCLSASTIKAFLDKYTYTNKTWHMTYITKELKKPEFSEATKKSMYTGTITHIALLEPELFENYVHACDIPPNTKEFKEFLFEKFGEHELTKEGGYIVRKSNDDREHYIITTEELITLSRMVDNVYKNKNAMSLLDNGVCETSGIAQCDWTGEFMSVRDDCRGEDYILDVKKIKKLTGPKVKKQIEDLRYWVQDIHYRRIGNLIEGPNRYKKFVFLFVEEEEPYQNHLFSLDLEYRKEATIKYRDAILEIKKLADSKSWDDMGNGTLIAKPKWGLK